MSAAAVLALYKFKGDVLWVVLAAAGIVLLADPGHGTVSGEGLALVLVAAACWAALRRRRARCVGNDKMRVPLVRVRPGRGSSVGRAQH